MSTQPITVKQIASRLENATSLERIDALQELQSIAKQAPELVGEHSLQKVLDFLKEQGSSEEYQEALDLIYRLVKCRDKTAAQKNTAIVLGDARSVELLLELLEHEDLMVGVMTSQILTEIHANDGSTLESQIQMCPDGMNKLLQRLPDTSREEVRNQAIVLIQQLTANNEEMKKTVVFNEGFEILFNIIRSEGGANDAGLVTQDCLAIANNILNNSETCQRLFFGMGVDWILRLADFFDPLVLESKFSAGGGDDSGGSSTWFDQPTRLSCAILALSALYSSLSVLDKKHQVKIVKSTSIVIPSAAFWVVRKGPLQLVNAALSLLYRAVDGNAEIAEKLCDELVKFSPSLVGKNIPFNAEAAGLHFSWRPSQEDDRRIISLPALLVERYIFPTEAWLVEDGLSLNTKLAFECSASGSAESGSSSGSDAFAQSCLKVFEKILAAGSGTSDLLVQYILAPPPPPGADMMSGKPHESMTPLGTLVLNVLVEGCQKVVGSSTGQQFGGMTVSSAYFKDMMAAERAANVMALVFIHGSSLAKEFATAIRDEHTSMRATGGGGSHGHAKAMPLLPILLATAGRTARIPNGGGYSLLVSLLRMLATIVSGCELATKQMLEDPANLFVVELATVASESAGIPSLVQVAACFFLGCCFEAFSDPQPSEGQTQVQQQTQADGAMNKSTFLSMIDKRIGLNRFTEILKKPLLTSRGGVPSNEFSSLFFCPGFKTFYESQVESIRKGIFSFYAGITAGHDGKIDAAMQQMLDMQKARIQELEDKLRAVSSGAAGSSSSSTGTASDASVSAAVDPAVVARYEAEIEQLKSDLSSSHHEKDKVASELSAVAAAMQEQSESHDQLVVQKAALESSLATQTQSLTEALSKVEEQGEMIDILKESAKEGKERALKAEAECESLRHQVKQLQAAISGDNEMQTLAMEESNKLNNKLQKQLTTANEELASLRQLLHAGSDEKLKLLDELTERNQIIQTLKEHQAQASLTSQSDAEQMESWEKMVQTVTQLVFNLGVEVADFDAILVMLQNPTTSSVEKSKWLEYLLNTCSFSVFTSVGQCCEMAIAAGVTEPLTGRDGSVQRLLDCAHRLSVLVHVVQTEKAAADAKVVSLSQELSELQHRLTASENEVVRSLEAEKTSLAAQSQALTQEVAELKQKLVAAAAVESEALTALQTEKAALAAQIDALSAELADVKQKLSTASASENEAVQSLQMEKVTLEAQTQSLSQQLSELQKTLTAAVAENEKLSEELNAVRHRLRIIESEKDELLALQESHQQAQTSESSAQIDKLTRDNHELSVRVTRLTETEKELQAELNKKGRQCAALEDQAEKTGKEIQTLTSKLKAASENVASLEAIVESNRSSSGNEINVLHARLKTATDNAAALESQLESDRTSAAAESEILKTQIKNLAEQSRELQGHLDAANSSLQGTMARLATTTEEVTVLTDKLKLSEEQRLALVNDLQDRNAAVESLTGQVSELQRVNQTLESTVQHLKNDKSGEIIAELEEEKGSLLQKVDLLKQEVSNSTTAVRDLTQARHELETALNRVQSESTEQLSTLKQQKDSEIEKLCAKLNEAASKVAERDRKVQEAEAALSQLRNELSQTANQSLLEAERLRSQLSVQQTETSERLLKEADHFNQQVEQVKRDKEQAVAKLQKQIHELNDRLTISDASNSKLVAENHALSGKNDATLQKLISVEKDLAEGRATVESLRAELEATRGQLKAAEEKHQRALEAVQQNADLAGKQQESVLAEKTAQIESLRKQLQYSELATGELLEQQSSLEMKVKECESAKAHAVELQKQINTLNITITDLKSKALHESKSVGEALNIAKTRERELETEIDQLRRLTEGLTQEASKCRLDAQRARQLQEETEESLAVVQTRCDSLEEQLSKSKVAVYNAEKAADDLRKELQLRANDVRMLKDSFEAEKLRIEERHKAVALMDPFRAQDHEMKRLSETCAQLTRDVARKDHLLQEMHQKLLHKEGEVAGMQIAEEGLKYDMDTLRRENEALTSKRLTDSKQIKEYRKELENLHRDFDAVKEEVASLNNQIARDKFRYQSVDKNSELLEKVETRLRDVLNWIVDSVDLSAYTERVYSKDFAYSCLELVDLIRACVEKVVGRLNSDLESQASRITEKEKKIQEIQRGTSSLHLLESSLITPSKKPRTSSNGAADGMVTPPHSGGGELTLIKSSVKRPSVSPSAKEAARLHAEILREKRKFSELSEQHSDLLGLLAQQEVELNVFRKALETKLSPRAVDQVESIAQQNVIELYGVYTNFRQNSDPEENLNIEEQLKAIGNL